MNKKYTAPSIFMGFLMLSSQESGAEDTKQRVDSQIEQKCESSYRPKSYNFTGWFMGFSGGYIQSHVNSQNTFQTDYALPGLTAINGLQSPSSIAGRGMRGGIQGGYGRQFQKFYLGMEAEFIFQSVQAQHRNVNFPIFSGILSIHDLSVKTKETLGFALKGGYVFDSYNLLFLKGGLVSSRFELSSVYPHLLGSTSVTNPTFKIRKHQFGFQLGGGFERAINKNLIAGAEVVYSDYKKIDYVHPRMSHGSISPSSIAFNIKLNFKFDS